MSETSPGQAATVTPAQAACGAYAARRGQSLGPRHAALLRWERLSDAERDCWEAAAKAVAPALTRLLDGARQLRDETFGELDRATERVAELVTEGNELREENGALRVIVAEVLARLEEALTWSGSPGDDAQIAGWSERAGLAPAVVTAGTEHLVPLIRGLAIPDEDTP